MFAWLEGYRVYDVATSSFHCVGESSGVPCGHLKFVSQGHGRISIMLGGANEATVLVREISS